MRSIYLLVLLTALTGCSVGSTVTGVTSEPQEIVLPSTCTTSEIARFHRGEETLLVYENQDSEIVKEDLRCMMLKAIGDGFRRNKVYGSNKPFGVSVFDIANQGLTRYFMNPSRSLFAQEVMTPTQDKKFFNTVYYIFLATPYDVAVVLGADGWFNIPAVDGGDVTVPSAQVYKSLGTFFGPSVLMKESGKDEN